MSVAKRNGESARRKIEVDGDALFARANELWESGKLKQAIACFRRAANHGDSGAQHNLGYFYHIGIGVRANRALALRWYRRAYRKGSGASASNIANIFRDQKMTAKALAWYQRALELHDADANVEIAKIYLSKQMDQRAVQYLRRAIRAKPIDITKGAQQEARKLLRLATSIRSTEKRSGLDNSRLRK